MTKQEYEHEINLMKKQNDTEVELYPLIAEIIKPTIEKDLSKRYVFARRKSQLGQIYYGLCSFPDIVILDCNYENKRSEKISMENWEKLKGCIEAKKYGTGLYSLLNLQTELKSGNESLPKAMQQLIGEILWYKKVLYTDGKRWKLFHIDSYNEKEEEEIIYIVNNRNFFEKWWKSETIKNIIYKIGEKNIVDNCLDNWDNFIKEIEKIKWK